MSPSRKSVASPMARSVPHRKKGIFVPAFTTPMFSSAQWASNLAHSMQPSLVSQWVSRRGRPAPAEACCEPIRPESARRLKFIAWQRPAPSMQAPPNPSIERTSPGKPGAASHVKR